MKSVRGRVGAVSRAGAACIFALGLSVLTGCSSIQVKLGMKVSLAKLPVASIEASLPKDPGIAPGEKSPLVVTVTETDGTVQVTQGKGKGKVLWSDLTVTPTVVTVNKKGVLSLDRDPRASDGKTGHVTITVASHPGVSTELDIPLRYNYAFAANFAGASGSNGSDGSAGQDGSSGSPGSIDPNNPSAGGDGSSGTNGGDGANGGAGEDGPPVQVFATLRAGSQPLLQIGVTSPGHKERFYLVDPQGGSLTVNDDGGDGGSGGKGGAGGHGGSGGVGTPNGSNGSDGLAGHDGSNGQSGNGGRITMTYDPAAQLYLSAIHLASPGGPAPVLKQAPVAALW